MCTERRLQVANVSRPSYFVWRTAKGEASSLEFGVRGDFGGARGWEELGKGGVRIG